MPEKLVIQINIIAFYPFKAIISEKSVIGSIFDNKNKRIIEIENHSLLIAQILCNLFILLMSSYKE
jgi:hypothetical protein